MNAREEFDLKNLQEIANMLNGYPDFIIRYIQSLERKTSYTKRNYAYYIKRFLDFIESEISYDIYDINSYSKIKPMDIDQYMGFIKINEKNNKENSATYRAAQYAAISGFFKYLKRNKIIEDNPCEMIEVPRDNKEHEIITLSDEDLKLMINHIKKGTGSRKAIATQKKWINRDIAILRLGVSTGLRVSAICGINMEDINLDDKYIIVTEKGNISKKIYLGNETVKAIKTWIEDRKSIAEFTESALFICQTGKRISPRIIRNRFKQITEGIDKRITPHKMRSTCATKLYEKTGDIYLVQQQLGHRNIKNTERYAKVSDARKMEAANILDSAF